jgi:3',5'-cyclic AMP phosphodiesterase CpdA
MTAPISIALCSDTHMWPMAQPVVGPAGSLLHVDHAEQLHHLLLDALAAAQPDLAIHLGDMTNGGGYFDMPAETFAPHLRSLASDWRGLPFPVYALPGNHDCPPAGAGLIEAAARFGAGPSLNGQPATAWRTFEELWGLQQGMGRTLDLEHAVLLMVHTQGHSAAQVAEALPSDPVYGWVSDAELERMEQALDEAGDRPVILLLHQLLRPWQAARDWQEFYQVANADSLLMLLEKFGNVRAVFQGHAHFYEVQPVELGGRPVPFVILPAIIESPLGWLQLTVAGDGMEVALQTLRANLPTPPGQQWRAGRDEWRRWRIDW